MKSLLKIVLGLFIVTLSFYFESCSSVDPKKDTVIESIESDKVDGKTFVDVQGFNPQHIGAFIYKDHIYVYTKVHSGISITHAGHCTRH